MGARIAVTGVNGFVGQHLVAELLAEGYDVVGVGHEAEPAVEGLREYREQDLTAGWPGDLHADAVVHLAGLSAVGPSFTQPQRYLATNSAMLTHLCEALLSQRSSARVLVVSSGAVYDAHQDLPLTEDSRIGHGSPYVVSKLLVEHQAAYYVDRGLDVVVARPFNHIGPGQGAGFLVPDLYDAARLAADSGGVMRVGDLSTRRDYTDVRDVVRAYRLLLESGSLGHHLFNVCSGRSRSGQEILGELSRTWTLGQPDVVTDPERVRPSDAREIIGSADRLRSAVGWRPRLDLASSLADFVRERQRQGAG